MPYLHLDHAGKIRPAGNGPPPAPRHQDRLTARQRSLTVAQHDKEYTEIEGRYFNKDGSEKPGAMLAPNGKRSNLNKRQWIQVRTASFKKWFGDWEALAKATMQRSAATLGQAVDAAKSFAGKQITNESTGLVAVVSNTNLGKMTSQAASSKSTSIEDHAQAVANADQLFRNALLDNSHADRKGEPTIAAIHRYVAPMITGKGEVVAVKMTVKETVHQDQPNPIYTIETMEIIKPTLDAPQGGIERATDIRNTPQVGFNSNVTKALNAVNPDTVSKVVEANGEPLVVYHGGPKWDTQKDSPLWASEEYTTGFFRHPKVTYAAAPVIHLFNHRSNNPTRSYSSADPSISQQTGASFDYIISLNSGIVNQDSISKAVHGLVPVCIRTIFVIL